MKKLLLILAMLMIFTQAAFAVEPIDIQETELDTKSRELVMTYIISDEFEPEAVVPLFYVKNDIHYERTDLNIADIAETFTEDVSVEKTYSAGHRFGPGEFSETIEYEKDGFVGVLTRDDDSFSISGSGGKTVKKPITARKTYTGLVQNDMGQIDRVYNGLTLSHVEWMDGNTGQSVRGYTDGSPGPYTCIAYYEGVQSSVVVTEYTASITYVGEATKETVTGRKAVVKYISKPMEPDTKKDFPLLPVIALSTLICAGGIMGLIYFFRKKRKVIR